MGYQGSDLVRLFGAQLFLILFSHSDQATGATGGIARAIFDRVFKWLIIKCNDTLIDPTMKKANFCAVLDIAGFEIFEYNGFEQISINFVNEKLQQFFNHHM